MHGSPCTMHQSHVAWGHQLVPKSPIGAKVTLQDGPEYLLLGKLISHRFCRFEHVPNLCRERTSASVSTSQRLAKSFVQPHQMLALLFYKYENAREKLINLLDLKSHL